MITIRRAYNHETMVGFPTELTRIVSELQDTWEEMPEVTGLTWRKLPNQSGPCYYSKTDSGIYIRSYNTIVAKMVICFGNTVTYSRGRYSVTTSQHITKAIKYFSCGMDDYLYVDDKLYYRNGELDSLYGFSPIGVIIK